MARTNFQPWRYGQRDQVTEMRKRIFDGYQRQREERERTEAWYVKDDRITGLDRGAVEAPVTARPDPVKKKSASLFDKLNPVDDIVDAGLGALGRGKDLAADVGKATLKGIGLAQEYVGEPLFANLSGQTAAKRVPIRDARGNITGYYREKPDWGDLFSGLGEAITDPVGAYKEGREAFGERLANPEQNALSRAVLNVSADPLNLIGPGIAARLVKATGASGKGARFLYEVLDSGGPGVVYGGAAGVAAVEQWGEEVPGFRELPPTLQMVLGGLAGGVTGGIAMRSATEAVQGRGALRGMGGSIIEEVEPRHLGATSKVNSAKYPGVEYGFRYRVVDMDDLVTSHTDDFIENPQFNQSFQPRNRDRAASIQQVNRIAGRPDPNRLLAETGDLQNGIPIIGADGMVESGNGRVMGLRRAAQTNPEGYAAYRDELVRRLPSYGFEPGAVDDLRTPVLVRERVTDVNRADFAAEANEASTARMGEAESAASEAAALSDEVLATSQIPASGKMGDMLRSEQNQRLRDSYVQARSLEEQGSLVSAQGQMSQQGLRRLTAAIYRKTYGSPAGQRLMESAFETTDDNARNVQLAMQDSLPHVAGLEAAIRAGTLDPSLSIADDVAAAADAFSRIKAGTLPYKTVEDYLLSISMFDDLGLSPQARAFLAFMDANTRSAKPLREALRYYVERVRTAANPNQAGMFGDAVQPDRDAILRDAFIHANENVAEAAASQLDIPTRAGQGTLGADVAPPPVSPLPESATVPQSPGAAAVEVASPAPSAAAATPTRTVASGVGTLTRTESAPVGGRPTGGVGARSGQGQLFEESPAPPAPAGPSGRPQPGMGQVPGDDLIGGRTIDELRSSERLYQGSRTGKVEQGIRKTLVKLGFGKHAENLIRDERFTPVWAEKNRIDNLRNDFKAQAEYLWSQVEASGLELEQAADGNWMVAGTGHMLGDVVEHATPEARAVWDNLPEPTKDALNRMTDLQDRARQTVEKYGGEMPLDESIEGAYWHRKVLAKGGQEKTSAVRTRRRLGSKQSFQRTRTQADMGNAAGREGLTYAHPLDAFTDGLDQKLKVAGDAYIAGLLRPNVVPNATPGFGFTEIPDVGVMADMDAVRVAAGLKPRELGSMGEFVQNINSFLTPIRASFDASGLFQQGMRRWMTDPKGALESWRVTVRSLRDPQVYFAALNEADQAGPGLEYLTRHGYRFTAEGAANEVTRLRAAGDVSGNAAVRAFQKGQDVSSALYDRPLNLHRIHSGNAAYARFVAQGLEGDALDNAMRSHATATNRMFGWTGTKPTTVESVALFAPRYFRSNVETLLKAVGEAGIERTEARKHLALLLGEGAAAVVVANELRGKDTEFDPRSSNFLRIRDVAGLDVSPFGSFDTLFRAIAATVGGDERGGIDPNPARLGRLAWGKASPALKLLIEPIRGETYLGKPLDPLGNPSGYIWEQFKSSVPFGAQNLIEGIEEGRTKDAIAGLAIGSTGLSQNPLTPTERRDTSRDSAAGKLFGKKYDDLTGDQKAQVNASRSVQRWQDKADDQALARGGERAQAVTAKRQAQAELAANAEYLRTGRDAAGNPFRPSDYREAYADIQQRLRGARAILEDGAGKNPDIDAWFALYDQAKMANGQTDYTKLEALQAEFERKHPGIREEVDANVGVNDDATLRELRRAQKEAAAYYEIPAYRGLSVDESRRAADILELASNMVAAGAAPSRNSALGMLRREDPEGALLARKALIVGANRERVRYRRSHPLFAKWYLDVASGAEAA